ncbi:MAG: response regulator [Nitrospirae bacterium]|nr:response regulator [Nitrospirota bacterium]MBF0542045.1 response regulator [Nitrospirota bacterium]
MINTKQKIHFNKKAFLAIDDFPDFRNTVRRLIQSLGVKTIDVVASADEAIEKITNNDYDVILCDYNLGPDKPNGQQILEEVKHKKLIKYSTIFLMITAEALMESVMGALEYKPDDYISKPFSKEFLQNRLEKIMAKKSNFEDIERAIQRDEYLKAIQLCDKHIDAKPPNIIEFLRLKGELLVKLSDYGEALTLYEKILEMRNFLWARLEMGKIHYYDRKYSFAKDLFTGIITDSPNYVEAHDWLAKTEEALGNPKAAQAVLLDAVQRSPNAILRRRALGDLSLKNKDYSVTEQAYKAAIDLGTHSFLKSTADYVHLANVDMINKSPEEALHVLDSARTMFKKAQNSAESFLHIESMSAIVYKDLKNDAKAEESLKVTKEMYKSFKGIVPANVAMDVAKACMTMNDKDSGIEIMKEIIKNNYDNDELMAKTASVFKDVGLEDEGKSIIEQTKNEAKAINNEGVKLVMKGDLPKAVDLFNKAVKGMPGNKIILANAVQALIMLIKEKGISPNNSNLVRQYLDQIKAIDSSYKKYQELHEEFEIIESKAPKPNLTT